MINLTRQDVKLPSAEKLKQQQRVTITKSGRRRITPVSAQTLHRNEPAELSVAAATDVASPKRIVSNHFTISSPEAIGATSNERAMSKVMSAGMATGGAECMYRSCVLGIQTNTSIHHSCLIFYM